MSARRVTALVPAVFAVLASTAAAQPSASGPMTVERLHSGVLLSADAKITEVDHRSGTLVGGEAAWVVDDTIGIGGAGYWLANNSRGRRMAYGGLTLRWLARGSERFDYGVRALIGGGEATLGNTVVELLPVRVPGSNLLTRQPVTVSVLDRENFFIAEPEANAAFRVLPHLRVSGGVGYRLIASAGRDNSRLRGVTGTVGVQLF
jgi:hypothetical protein